MMARLTIVSLAGFAVSASFVTVDGFELPFYVVLVGACGLKLAYSTVPELDKPPTFAAASDAVHVSATRWPVAARY
jgi:hypothetical protein